MAAITSTYDGYRTVIIRRQNVRTWILATPYIFYEAASVAIVCAAAYRITHDLRTHLPFRGSALVIGLFFAWKSWLLGRGLHRMLLTHSILTIQGDMLSVCYGTRFNLRDFGTYPAATLTELAVEPGNNLHPSGQVEVLVGGVPLVLADCISTGDGNRLIDLLCDAYPFRTPEPTPSPYVTRW